MFWSIGRSQCWPPTYWVLRRLTNQDIAKYWWTETVVGNSRKWPRIPPHDCASTIISYRKHLMEILTGLYELVNLRVHFVFCSMHCAYSLVSERFIKLLLSQGICECFSIHVGIHGQCNATVTETIYVSHSTEKCCRHIFLMKNVANYVKWAFGIMKNWAAVSAVNMWACLQRHSANGLQGATHKDTVDTTLFRHLCAYFSFTQSENPFHVVMSFPATFMLVLVTWTSSTEYCRAFHVFSYDFRKNSEFSCTDF